MDYVERRNLIKLLKSAKSLEELIDLFSDDDVDTGYQEYYSTSLVRSQINEASRTIVDMARQDKMYVIIDYDVLNQIINGGGTGLMDKYSDTKF
jgi:hypothetical protein